MVCATVGNESFSIELEGFTRDSGIHARNPFSRHRDFTVPFSKPGPRLDYPLDTTSKSASRLLKGLGGNRMSKTGWGTLVSIAFAVALTFTPLPDNVRLAVVTSAWTLCVSAAIGWFVAHKRESKEPQESITPRAIAERYGPSESYGHKRIMKALDDFNELQTKRGAKAKRLRSIVVEIRDLVISTKQNEATGPYDVLGGLIKFSEDFDTEDDVKFVSGELEHEFGNPFKTLEAESNNALQGAWLKFLRDARVSGSNIRTIYHAFGWAATKWRHAERWKQGRRAITKIYPEPESEWMT